MNNSTKNIVVTVIAVLLVLVIAGVTVFFVKSKDNKNDIKESTTQAEVLEESNTSAQTTEAQTDFTTEVLTTIMSTTKRELTDEAFFKSIAGKFDHSSGAGAWYEYLVLYKDGSFKGKYHNWDAFYEGKDGYGEGSVNFEREYTGKFSNVKRINEYVYTAKVAQFIGKGELGSYTMVKDETQHITYTVISEAPFEGSTSVKIYLKGMPRKYADEGIESLVNSKISDSNRDWTELSFNIIDSQGAYSRFVG